MYNIRRVDIRIMNACCTDISFPFIIITKRCRLSKFHVLQFLGL